MIYAYDQAIQLPVKDLYDSQIMMASINAAREMYQKGEQAIKDFNKEYGDFITPIQKDQDWYNFNVLGRAQREIENMYEQGIDPVRSSEGRARVQKLINSMPYGKINNLKQSAKNANAYLENKAALERAGLYNNEFEDAITGGFNINNWSTIDNGSWNRLSPTEYKDLNKATSHWFDGYKDEYMYTKDGYDWYGISTDRIKNAITKNMTGFINSDYGRYYYNNAKNELAKIGIDNPSEAMIIQKLSDNIVTANDEITRKNRVMNEKYKMQLDLRNRVAAARAGKSDPSPIMMPQTPLSYTQKVERSAMERTMGAVMNRMTNIKDTSERIANQYKNRANNERDPKAKNRYLNKYNTWVNINKEISSAKDQKTLDSILRKHNITDKNGAFSSAYTNEVRRAYKTTSGRANYGDTDTLYDVYRGDVQGLSKDVTTKILADSGQRERYPEGSGKYMTVTFGSGSGVNLSRVRRTNVTGGRLTSGSIANIFNKWAKKNKIKGYLVSEQTSPYYIPNGYGELDASGTISIPMNQFENFVLQNPGIGIKNSDGTITDDINQRLLNAANSLGFVVKNYNGKEYKVDDELKSDDKYAVWIPVTRTVQNNGTNFSDLDVMEDNIITGKSTTSKRQILRQANNLGK